MSRSSRWALSAACLWTDNARGLYVTARRRAYLFIYSWQLYNHVKNHNQTQKLSQIFVGH